MVAEIGSRNKSPRVLSGSINSDSPTSQIMQPQGLSIASSDTMLPSNTALNNQPQRNALPPGDRLCVGIMHFSKQDFRREPWYLDNLFLLTSFTIGLGCIVLPIASVPHFTLDFDTGPIIIAFLMLLPIGLISCSVIPLCAVANSLQDRDLSPSLSGCVIRLAVDPRRSYRALRWVYFLSWPIAASFFATAFYLTFGVYFVYAMIPILCWGGISFALFVCAVYTGLFSIYSQI